MTTTSNGYPPSSSQGGGPSLLADRFPVNSLQQLTLETGESVSGRVYCTDEGTGSIVLQKELVHTTLASEIRIISVASVTQSVTLPEVDADDDTAATAAATVGSVAKTPLTQALAKVQKKALDERERRAIRLAEESLRHINQKASPVGQAVFDRLLKACGEVVWKGDTTSILVLNQIQVDEPYQPENCEIIASSASGNNGTMSAAGSGSSSSSNAGSNGNGALLEDGSLDRVKKIVAAVAADSAVVANT